ncbi:MAG TPA: hypothetical protein VMW63_07565 [Methanoregulaceae archaeon]|nr:hypothetical protein [Methanoregulaceae archaeon]
MAELYEMRTSGNVEGLLTAIYDENEYIRSAAADALVGYPELKVKDTLGRVKFDDPVLRVREAATRAHLMVVQATRIEKKE